MEKKIKDYLMIVPYTVPIIYFLGYILISGYLSNFNYTDYDLLNLTYLKAGILFTILLAIIFISTRIAYTKETMTDNFKIAWISILLAFHNILLISYFIIMFLIDYSQIQPLTLTIIVLLSLIFSLYYFFTDNKKVKSIKGFLFIVVPSILILLSINMVVAYNSKLAMYLLIFNTAITIFLSISIGLYGDRNYTRKIITGFLIIVIACFIFGYKIYGMLPYKLGGGKPYKILIDNECLNNQIDRPFDTLKVYYENDRDFILEKNEQIFVLNKNEIKCFQLLNSKLLLTKNSAFGR